MNALTTIGVVGAGTMGLGIAQVCASAGFKTILFDIHANQLSLAVRTISNNLSQSVEKGRMSSDVRDAALRNVFTTHTLADVKADMIIEAAVEKLEVKQKLFGELELVNGGKSILATNTSSISVTRIAENLQHKTLCIGLHFFNPADKMKLVEIISGNETDPSLVSIMKDFCVRIGKTPVLAKDSPGFIVNRVARHYYVESLKLLEEHAISVADADALLRSAGFKMGPFELMDLIGVDTNLAVTTSVYEGFNKAPKFAPSATQQQLVKEGKLGKKSGKGFYDYSK